MHIPSYSTKSPLVAWWGHGEEGGSQCSRDSPYTALKKIRDKNSECVHTPSFSPKGLKTARDLDLNPGEAGAVAVKRLGVADGVGGSPQ